MAALIGRITRTGQGAAGLRIAGYEEVRIGSKEEEHRPCQMSHPIVNLVGDDVTDSSGDFRITYTPYGEPEDACVYSSRVRVRVYDGAAFLWQSPNRPGAASVRFDHDLLPSPPPPDPDATFRIVGTLTRCGRPAAGHLVVGFEETRTGEPYQGHPCVLGSTVVHNVGSAIVGDDGSFEIKYVPVEATEDACRFEADVRVQAFDGSLSVWRSSTRPLKRLVRFDREIYPGCDPASTLIRVVNEGGQRVAGAEVFVKGELRGRTDSLGQLFVPGVASGDQLVARLRLLESSTDRDAHAADSDSNWNYRVYITSVMVSHDSNGDTPRLQTSAVTSPAAVHDLVIQRRNVIIGFNLVVSVEWDATSEELTFYRDRFLEFSELLFNGTDGQFLIERVAVFDNRAYWDHADYRVYANWNQPSNADSGAIHHGGGRIRMNPHDTFFPGTLYHEMGHYAFSVMDEYEGGPQVCTAASEGTGTPFSNGGGKDSCVMRGARNESRKKFCSSHPANPHVTTTEQGPEDCWTAILERFAGLPAWRLLTPVSRGAIVDRLPDSGVPLGTSTSPPVDPTDSYIPVAGWKPVSSIADVARPGERPRLIVRTLLDGAPIDNVLVELRTPDGRHVRQGRTQQNELPDHSTGQGEISIRGAHVGDKIWAIANVVTSIYSGEATVPSGTDPLVVELHRVTFAVSMQATPIGVDQIGIAITQLPASESPVVSVLNDGESAPFTLATRLDRSRSAHVAAMTPPQGGHQDSEVVVTACDATGKVTVVRSRLSCTRIFVDEPRTIRSTTGDVELWLPAGALTVPVQVLVEEAVSVPWPDLGGGDTLLVPPHRLASSRGDSLRGAATLYLTAGSGMGKNTQLVLELLRYDDTHQKWHPLRARVHPDPITASTSIDRLGVFAVVRRAPRGRA